MENKLTNYNSLKKYSQSNGADLFGVADIRQIKKDFRISSKALDKVDQAISLGVRLSQGILGEIESAPTRLYFHHYRTANAFLDQLAFKVSSFIQKKGFLALPIPASQIVDWQNQKAHLSHRLIGLHAGLGWIGRNNLLVSPETGSQFRMATILTNIPLKLDKPLQKDCGKCRLCVELCPAQAIQDDPKAFDPAKCLDKLKEFQKQRLVDQYICGVCVNICAGKTK